MSATDWGTEYPKLPPAGNRLKGGETLHVAKGKGFSSPLEVSADSETRAEWGNEINKLTIAWAAT